MNARQKLHQVHLNEWITCFAEQKAAGLTNKEYCELHQISIHSYNYWKRVLREQVVNHMLPDIVPVTLPSTIPNAATSIPTQSFTHSRVNCTQTAKGTVTYEAYELITEILHEENKFDVLPKADRLKQRRTVLKPKVDAYFQWVNEKHNQVTKSNNVGKTLVYSINQEQILYVFLDNPDIPMDNNFRTSHQAIYYRPQNFVLIESSNGAKANAILYSLAETAKANELNTYKYFELLLTEIPKHMGDKNLDFLEELLPWNPKVKKECASHLKKS